jgi:hypothetical protein
MDWDIKITIVFIPNSQCWKYCIKFTKQQVSHNQGFKKRSRSRLSYVKVFAISVGTGVTTLIAVVAVWINHNLFFNIKTVIHSNGIVTCKNRFVAAVFAVADLYLKPWLSHINNSKFRVKYNFNFGFLILFYCKQNNKYH